MGEQINLKKSILLTILYTMLALLVGFGIFVLIMCFGFTSSLAAFMKDVGCYNMASGLYYRSYEKSGNIDYCYQALCLKINLGDDDKIVEYYESYISDDDYKQYSQDKLKSVERVEGGVLAKSTMLTEEYYLASKYVNALIAQGSSVKAWQVAIDSIIAMDEINLYSQGNYMLSKFVGEDNTKFNKKYQGMDSILIVEMQECFDEAILLFDNNKDSVSSNTDRAYLMALGNRIITLGQDINKIYETLGEETTNIASNLNTMLEVNNKIKGLI